MDATISEPASESSLRQAIADAPTDVAAHLGLIRYLFDAEQYMASLRAIDEAELHISDDRSLNFWRGCTYYRIHEFRLARQCLEASATESSSYLEWFWLATTLERLGDPRALESYDVSIERTERLPSDEVVSAKAAVLKSKVSLLARDRKWEDAISACDTYLSQCGENSSIYRQRGDCFAQLRDHVSAESDWSKALQLELEQMNSKTNNQRFTHAFPILQRHFHGLELEQMSVRTRKFPPRVRVDLQWAIDETIGGNEEVECYGVRNRYRQQAISLGEIITQDVHDPITICPLEWEEVDIGEESSVQCVQRALWTFKHEGKPFAALVENFKSYHSSSIVFQVLSDASEESLKLVDDLLSEIESSIANARSLRGKIITFENTDDYSGRSSEVRILKLPSIGKDQVILGQNTLELLDRNIIQFCRSRKRLASLGLATKKGVLFYGPPGTGKTHTITYLTSSIPDVTTLIITAEQVGLLSEYMALARLLQPSMVVIEDADLIAGSRESANTCEEVLLNKLLNEMDGLTQQADILFILSTNRPEAIEEALRSRPGRIDQAIEFPYPDDECRRRLIDLYRGDVAIDPQTVEEIVRRTNNVSAAFIKELMRRSVQCHIEPLSEFESPLPPISLGPVLQSLDEMVFSGGSLNQILLGMGDSETE